MGETADALDKSGAVTESSDPTAIRSDIEQTRAEMTQTIDAIQDKLNPEHLKEQAKETVREATVGNAQRLAQAVRAKIDDLKQPGGLERAVQSIKQRPAPALAALGALALGTGVLVFKAKRKRRCCVPDDVTPGD